ncbi:MAG: response regulator [Candidatus Brocadiae bacterium]|nr:response regulator [Candidatus Brocadiia bacterium]
MAKTILIIDDDFEYVESTTAALQASGYKTISRENGTIGFEAAKSTQPDLIILDVMMRYDSEGLDTVGKLCNDPATKTIPILLITGIRHPEDLPVQSEAIKATLEKPIQPDLLISAIEKVLGK